MDKAQEDIRQGADVNAIFERDTMLCWGLRREHRVSAPTEEGQVGARRVLDWRIWRHIDTKNESTGLGCSRRVSDKF